MKKMTDATQPVVSIALLSTSTVQLLAGDLRKDLKRWGWETRIWQSGFNQYRQEIANPSSALYSEQPDIVVLHLDGEDLFADLLRNPFSADYLARPEQAGIAVTELENLIATLKQRLPSALLVLNTIYFPPINSLTGLEFHSQWSITALVSTFNSELGRIAKKYSDVLIHDVAALVSNIGYRRWFDPRLWYLARCRLSSEASKNLARSLGALLRAWKGQTRKCIALDLDNTLWGGVIGEDGPNGIVIGEEGLGLAYAEFQSELLNLARKGVILAICSKNNEEEALEALRQHQLMRLRPADFAARRINWADKASNLRELAVELNIGLDSFVFVDDNPAERELIRASLPEVLVPEWPQDPSEFKAALLDLAAEHFPRTSLTTEDQQRSAMYLARGKREVLAAGSGNLEHYYRSLEMRISIDPGDDSSVRRISQLTQKTNQFNLTTRRYTEAEIRDFLDSPAIVWSLRLSDRFADEGIVGVLILRESDPGTWNVDTLLLSCRVIGRTIEQAFVAYACRYLKGRGAKALIGEYLPTQRNGLAANVYRDLAFEEIQRNQNGTQWRILLDENELSIPDWIAVETAEEITYA